MARVETASASVNSDSIKGLAQSIAKPAYRRLLTAEPALRRAVPALIVAFLITICIGAVVQVFDHRRQAVGEIVRGMTASAEILADRFGRSSVPDDKRKQTELEHAIPAWALVPGRQILLANNEGAIVAAVRVVVAANNGIASVVARSDNAAIGRP
ncbi:MAG: PAS domain-containing sensor histidine kinase, partial [Xanthobacteraceae bacterium]